MNVSTMRRVDRWAGVPCCLLLTLLRWISDRWARTRSPDRASRILLVKPAEQGATVLAYPAIRQAIDRVGRENVFFLVFEENRFILDVMQVVPSGNVITIPTDGLWRLTRGPPRSSTWNRLPALRNTMCWSPGAIRAKPGSMYSPP